MSEQKQQSRWETWDYFIRDGFHNFRYNRAMTIASIVILASCLLMSALSSLLFSNLNTTLSNVQEQNVIMVYLDNKVTAKNRDQIEQQIRKTVEVKTIEFVSKDQAYRQQIKSLGEDASFVKSLGSNPFPDSFQVTLQSLKNYDSSMARLQAIPHVTSVRGNSQLAGQVKKLRDSLVQISSWILVLLILVSLFIIMSTIYITMNTRKNEIDIEQMVGATRHFIRTPYVLEGTLMGALSGFLAYLLTTIIYGISQHSLQNIQSVVGGHVLPFSQFAGPLLFLLLIGMALGGFGSWLSATWYMNQTFPNREKEKKRATSRS